MKNLWKLGGARVCGALTALSLWGLIADVSGGQHVFSVRGNQVLLNGTPFKIIGLRCPNSLISPAKTQELIDQLDFYKSHGINTISVYLMGSRFGDIKGYNPDASLNTIHKDSLGRIIEAADARGMIVLVGCLYWGTSRAKEELGHWGQSHADLAVANTVAWLSLRDFRNVFIDPDNEGMSPWSIASMITAGHSQDPSIMIAANGTNQAPSHADLFIHHSPIVPHKPYVETEGTPTDYWAAYSRHRHDSSGGRYYNYSRIGRYSASQKSHIHDRTDHYIHNQAGYMFASTWLQCGPAEGANGPFLTPGGQSNITDVDAEIDVLHQDAGVLWWLEHVRRKYGAWVPPNRPVTYP